MLKNRVPAPRAALVQYRVLPCAHTRAALVRMCALRRHAILHATTSGGIMNDAVLVCIRKMIARAHTPARTALCAGMRCCTSFIIPRVKLQRIVTSRRCHCLSIGILHHVTDCEDLSIEPSILSGYQRK